MSTEVATKANGGAAVANPRKDAVLAKIAALKAGGAVPREFSGGVNYCKLDGTTGAFVYGKDANEMPADQMFMVPIEEAEHGHLEWFNGAVERRLMGKVLDGQMPPLPKDAVMAGDLPEPNDQNGFKQEMTMPMIGYKGDLDGIQMEFTSRASSQMQDVTNLLAACIAQSETPAGQEGFFNPIVVADPYSFHSKKRKRDFHSTRWTIVGWTDGQDVRMNDAAPAEALSAPTDVDAEDLINS